MTASKIHVMEKYKEFVVDTNKKKPQCLEKLTKNSQLVLPKSVLVM
jgi:hypothetical protein